jgi:hypothetical protein
MIAVIAELIPRQQTMAPAMAQLSKNDKHFGRGGN